MARKAKARPKAKAQPELDAEHCLDPFLSLGEIGPQEGARVVRTRRGRMDSANAGKKAELAFAQERLAREAQLMADFAFDLWEREGRIPALAATLKFKNIPHSALAQSLWAQVSSGVRGWISNRENDLADELSRLSRPSQKLIGPVMDRGLLLAALRAGAHKNPAARLPCSNAVRAAWARAQARCAKPSWRHVPISLNSHLLSLDTWRGPAWPWPTAQSAKEARAAERAEKKRKAAGAPSPKKKRMAPARKAKMDKKRKIPKPTHWGEITLPQRSEWPERPILDWRLAIVDEPGSYESKEAREARFAEEVAEAAAKGLPIPEEPSPRASGRKSPCKTQTLALPLWLGEDFGSLPGKLSQTVALIPPRADKGRKEWEARLAFEIPAEELAVRGASRQALLAMDMGLTHLFATNADAQRVRSAMDAELALGGEAEASEWERAQKSLHFILSGWKGTIGPKVERLADVRARRQSQGLAARCEKLAKLEKELDGLCKTKICTSLKGFVAVVKPLGIVLEDLDFQGPVEIKRKLPCGRVVVIKNKRLSRLWHRFGKGVALGWLESRGPVHGWALYKENRAYTSQQCSSCGVVDSKSREGERFNCTSCGLKIQADLNAALVLEERFLWSRWLSALGPAAAGGLGLGGAFVERWMSPGQAMAALLERESFLRDGGRLAKAAGERLLPSLIGGLSKKRSSIGGAANRPKEGCAQKGAEPPPCGRPAGALSS